MFCWLGFSVNQRATFFHIIHLSATRTITERNMCTFPNMHTHPTCAHTHAHKLNYPLWMTAKLIHSFNTIVDRLRWGSHCLRWENVPQCTPTLGVAVGVLNTQLSKQQKSWLSKSLIFQRLLSILQDRCLANLIITHVTYTHSASLWHGRIV